MLNDESSDVHEISAEVAVILAAERADGAAQLGQLAVIVPESTLTV